MPLPVCGLVRNGYDAFITGEYESGRYSRDSSSVPDMPHSTNRPSVPRHSLDVLFLDNDVPAGGSCRGNSRIARVSSPLSKGDVIRR